jgi:hypothetical protein
LRNEILRCYHDDPLAGHFGQDRTEELVKRKFFWTGMANFIAEYVRSCTICQHNYTPNHPPYGNLTSLPIPDGPFQELTMDFITGLPPVEYESRIVDAIVTERADSSGCS